MRAVLAMLAVVSACGLSTFPKPAPGIRIAGDNIRQFAKRTDHHAREFRLAPNGTSGTGLVVAYLEAAQRKGARYVSDLAIVVQFERNRTPLECVSKIVVANGVERAPPAVAPVVEPLEPGEYSTTVKPWVPDTVDAWVDDRDLVCKAVPEQVVSMQPLYENRLDAEVGEYIAPGTMPMHKEASLEWSTKCATTTTRRKVHRYEHYVAARFTPADWTTIARTYSDWKLTEEAPRCHEIPRPSRFVQRIEADLHFTGSLRTNEAPELWKK
jgi:hypothetical protein